jgi:hypothetical protein
MIPLRNLLCNNEWNFVPPNESQILMISVFDDGNECFEQHENEWILFGNWRGKVAIYNKAYPTIIIRSISMWKTNTI